MSMVDVAEIGKDVLSALHYRSLEDAGRSLVYVSSLAKVSEYKGEDQQFEKKYGTSFEVFKRRVDARTDEEDFDEEEDLMAWQFAHESRLYWEAKTRELEQCF